MPAKHSARPLGPARLVLSAASAVLVLLVVWIAVRAVGPAEASRQPSVVLPSMPQVQLSPSPLPSAPSLSPSPSSASPSATRRTTESTHKPSSPATRRATSPTPRPSRTTPTPRAAFSAQVNVTASWEQGYVAMVRVQNTGSVAATWTVTVTHSGLSNLRLAGTWNARGSQSGDNVVFTGGALAPGATANFGYQVSKSGRGNARPAGCTVAGGRCGVS